MFYKSYFSNPSVIKITNNFWIAIHVILKIVFIHIKYSFRTRVGLSYGLGRGIFYIHFAFTITNTIFEVNVCRKMTIKLENTCD